jgi:hypothetical protein
MMSDRKREPARRKTLCIGVSRHLSKQIALRAIHEEVSQRYLVILALKAYGFDVHEEDLAPDSRRVRRQYDDRR